MLLILSNSTDATADYLASRLATSEVPFLRIDTDTIVPRASFNYLGDTPRLSVDNKSYSPTDFHVVWYRRPERLKHAQMEQSAEGKYALAEWAETLEGFFALIPSQLWMNHPSANASASHKIEQLQTAARLGFRVPDTVVLQDQKLAEEFYRRCNREIITKPISSGYIERGTEGDDSIIYTNRVEGEHFNDSVTFASCPTLLQQFVNKRCDVRVTVVDAEFHAVALTASDETGRQRCDIRRNNMQDVHYSRVVIPDDIRDLLIRVMTHYKLRFAAVDFAIDHDDRWYFFEINPNGQWAWLDLSAGQDIAASFVESFSGSLR